ncbi:MAG: hypothetical protein ACODAE_00935 [Gemmatimonadota bacterium]
MPFGSFSTIRVAQEYRETGQYAAEDIFDTASERYAPDLGMVRGSWDCHYDDNDPGGTDLFTEGTIELTHMDTGPFPELVPEGEPNDDHTAATVLSGFAIGEGDILMGDDAVIIDDADVGCSLDECVHPDATGQKRIQDWFRLDVDAETEIRIALDFLTYDAETGQPSDLDLYLFAGDGSGGLIYLDRADDEHGRPARVRRDDDGPGLGRRLAGQSRAAHLGLGADRRLPGPVRHPDHVLRTAGSIQLARSSPAARDHHPMTHERRST